MIEYLLPVFQTTISHLGNYCRQPEPLLLDCVTKVPHSYTWRTEEGTWIIRVVGWGDPFSTPFAVGHELTHYHIRSGVYVRDRSLIKGSHFQIEELICTLMGLWTVEKAKELYQRGQYTQYLQRVEEQKMVRRRLVRQAIEEKHCNPLELPLVEPLSGEIDYINIELLAFHIFPVFHDHPQLWEILPHTLPILARYNPPSMDVFLNLMKERVGDECSEAIDCLLSFLYP